MTAGHSSAFRQQGVAKGYQFANGSGVADRARRPDRAVSPRIRASPTSVTFDLLSACHWLRTGEDLSSIGQLHLPGGGGMRPVFGQKRSKVTSVANFQIVLPPALTR